MRPYRFALIVGCLLTMNARPQGTCPAAGDISSTNSRIVIDARTGRTSAPTKAFETGPVDLVIHNKNPFRFAYKVTVKEEEVKETGLAAFLPIFGDFVSGFGAVTAASASASPGPPGAAGTSSPLSQIEGFHTRLIEELKSAQLVFPPLGEKHRIARLSYKKYREVLDADYWTCGDLVAAAGEIQRITLADTKDARNQLTTVRGLATSQLNAINALPVAEQVSPRVRELKAFAEAVSIAGEGWAEKLDRIESETTDLGKAIKSVKAAAADPEAFWEKQPLGPFPVHTKVNVEVKVVGSDGKTVSTITVPTLTFGSPVFVLSGGMVISMLDQRQYVRVQSAREGSGGAIELVNRVGRSEASNFRLLPMALLHIKVYPKYFVSIGATAKPDKQGTQPEFLFGGSRSFASGWLFLTAGAYIGKQNSLEGGLFEGAIVPSTLAEIPMRKSTAVRFGFSLSIKLR